MNIKETISTIQRMEAEGVISGHAIGGAVGANFYVEVAFTEDIDVFVLLSPQPGQLIVSLEGIHRYLEGVGWPVDRGGYSVIAGWKVQFLPANEPLAAEALKQSVVHRVDDLSVRVFSAEHLAALALQVGRAKDKARILQFLEAGVLDAKQLNLILTRHGLLDRWVRLLQQLAE